MKSTMNIGWLLSTGACGALAVSLIYSCGGIEKKQGALEKFSCTNTDRDKISNPFIAHWSAEAKKKIDEAARKGNVIKSEDKLGLQFPLAFKFVKEFMGGVGLSENNQAFYHYVSVGSKNADRAPDSISGECAGATHYIKQITIGASEVGRISDQRFSADAIVLRGEKNLYRKKGTDIVCLFR